MVGSSSPHHSWGCTSRWFTVGQRHPPQLKLVNKFGNLNSIKHVSVGRMSTFGITLEGTLMQKFSKIFA